MANGSVIPRYQKQNMFIIEELHTTGKHDLHVKNGSHLLVIDLINGGRTKSWHHAGQEMITPVQSLAYSDTYAGAILFPFANRIKNGTYRFRESEYQLDINDTINHCALHGLIYNKSFQIINKNVSEDFAEVKLLYQYRNDDPGFPFQFDIGLTYTISDAGLKLKAQVENTGSDDFPFTIGWHPYFKSANLKKSILTFDSDHKITLDKQLITSKVEPFKEKKPFPTNANHLDNCYRLEKDPVVFKTPEYALEMNSSSDIKYLQFYTPPEKNAIALEPTTGISDSFNNGRGIQVLKPAQKYNVTWSLKVLPKPTH